MSDLAEQVVSEEAELLSERDAHGRFMPGRSGNPAGMKPGTRHKFGPAMVQAFRESFENVGGKDYLQDLATHEPKAYATLIGMVLGPQIKADLLRELAEGDKEILVIRDYAGVGTALDSD